MIGPLSLSNVATVAFAAICLWTIAAQVRGNVVKLWRLAVPPSFAAVQAFVLLAGVFDATIISDAEWLAAAVAGGVIGRMRGWALTIEVDQRWDLVRQHRSAAGYLRCRAIAIAVRAAHLPHVELHGLHGA